MEKIWNKKFVEYMNFIINHPNYNGLPITKRSDGSYSWIAPAKGNIGLERINWAKNKMKELGISENDKSPYSKLMFEIHPTKEKVCQICGNTMSLYYIYINSSFAKSIKKEFNYNSDITQSIYDVCNDLIALNFEECHIKKFLIDAFHLDISLSNSLNFILQNCEKCCRNGNSKKLGPGAMSNFPDRFDGFHTYNRCCRSKEDKGRSKENLRTYGKDRRAYEYWSDGNIYAANLFMHSHYFIGTSADHIGPISLGFVHDSHYLQPMSAGENSSKRDKLSLEDINTLINIENSTGISAISSFSSEIWKYIKQNYLDNKNDIPIYRELLKQNMTNFMFIIWTINNKCKTKGKKFLIKTFLEPKFDYFNYDYSFNVNGEIIKKTLRHKTDSSKNEINRYIRIAFESINDYNEKDNRNLKNTLDKVDLNSLYNVCALINSNYAQDTIVSLLKNLIISIEQKLIEKNVS